MDAEVQSPRNYLYRHFDAAGVLLYVGVSLSVVARLGQHKDHSHWYASIARVDIEQFETRSEALAAERKAVHTEKPLHNIALRSEAKIARTTGAKFRAQQSRDDLTSVVVHYHVFYKINQLPLPLTQSQIEQYIDDGVLGYFELPSVTGHRMRRYVSGWQLIDFLEWLHAQPKKTRA